MRRAKVSRTSKMSAFESVGVLRAVEVDFIIPNRRREVGGVSGSTAVIVRGALTTCRPTWADIGPTSAYFARNPLNLDFGQVVDVGANIAQVSQMWANPNNQKSPPSEMIEHLFRNVAARSGGRCGGVQVWSIARALFRATRHALRTSFLHVLCGSEVASSQQ